MSIRANFAGTCAGCGYRYPEGTQIQLIENYGWCHDQCPDPTNITEPAEVSCTALLERHEDLCLGMGLCDRSGVES